MYAIDSKFIILTYSKLNINLLLSNIKNIYRFKRQADNLNEERPLKCGLSSIIAAKFSLL